MDKAEIWKDVPHYEGLYQISNKGNVWSIKSNRLIKCKPSINNNPYLRVTLTNRYGKIKNEYIHRLVALAFIPNANNYTFVHHKDDNKLNNNVENLEWITKEMHNTIHKTGVPTWNKGLTKETDPRVMKISEGVKLYRQSLRQRKR